MSHFSVIVLTKGEDPVAEATRLLAPYDEAGEWFADGSRWDWWVIGGRWTGSLDGYDPTTDPANVEVCDLCSGTGTRPGGLEQFGQAWFDQCNGCNGCSGKGTRVKWTLAPHDGDIAPVTQIGEFLPFAIVTPDGEWHEGARMGWFAMTSEEPGSTGEDAWPRAAAELLLAHRECTAVLVDCHV